MIGWFDQIVWEMKNAKDLVVWKPEDTNWKT
jgi:hypothetical protein